MIKTLINSIAAYIPRPLPQTAPELESLLLGALAFAKMEDTPDARQMVCGDLMRYEGHYRSIASFGKVLTRFRANQRAWEVIESINEAKKLATKQAVTPAPEVAPGPVQVSETEG